MPSLVSRYERARRRGVPFTAARYVQRQTKPGNHLYEWKEMIGPRDKRKPYTGRFNPYTSHGFGIFEFLDMCNAMGGAWDSGYQD